MKLKNVQFMPRVQASVIIPSRNHGMISISCPSDPAELNQLWTRERLLRLQFHDADDEGNINLMLGQKVMGTIGAKLFSQSDAKQVIEFAENLKNQVDTIFVHCDAGISRSAAVAKFIAEMYSLRFPESYMLYNKYVYRVLRNTLNNMTWKERYEP